MVSGKDDRKKYRLLGKLSCDGGSSAEPADLSIDVEFYPILLTHDVVSESVHRYRYCRGILSFLQWVDLCAH